MSALGRWVCSESLRVFEGLWLRATVLSLGSAFMTEDLSAVGEKTNCKSTTLKSKPRGTHKPEQHDLTSNHTRAGCCVGLWCLGRLSLVCCQQQIQVDAAHKPKVPKKSYVCMYDEQRRIICARCQLAHSFVCMYVCMYVSMYVCM